MKSIVEFYSPSNISEFLGQKTEIEQIGLFLKNKNTKKAMLVHGPTGCGKSTAIKLAAKNADYVISELVPDMLENESSINDLLKTASLFNTKKVILIDDLEAFYSKRGAIAILMKAVKSSLFPVIFVALDVWDQKLRYLRMGCYTIQFKKYTNLQISTYLKKICETEETDADGGTIDAIAKNANGDLRAALHDLSVLASGQNKITEKDLGLLEQRPKEENIFNSLQKIFKTTDVNEANAVFENVGVDPEMLIMWLAENIQKEYSSPGEVADAYNFLSKADVFLGRIRRRQHWGFLKYAIALATAGVAVSKEKSSQRFVRYTSPMKFNKLAQTKSSRAIIKSVSEKVAGLTHTSSRTVSRHYLPMLKIMFKTNPDFKKRLTEKLELEKDEVSFLSA